MTRFFFDIGSGKTVYHDFKGCQFAKAEEAFEMANLIALDLSVMEDDRGTEVQVRNDAGRQLYQVRVGDPDATA